MSYHSRVLELLTDIDLLLCMMLNECSAVDFHCNRAIVSYFLTQENIDTMLILVFNSLCAHSQFAVMQRQPVYLAANSEFSMHNTQVLA